MKRRPLQSSRVHSRITRLARVSCLRSQEILQHSGGQKVALARANFKAGCVMVAPRFWPFVVACTSGKTSFAQRTPSQRDDAPGATGAHPTKAGASNRDAEPYLLGPTAENKDGDQDEKRRWGRRCDHRKTLPNTASSHGLWAIMGRVVGTVLDLRVMLRYISSTRTRVGDDRHASYRERPNSKHFRSCSCIGSWNPSFSHDILKMDNSSSPYQDRRRSFGRGGAGNIRI